MLTNATPETSPSFADVEMGASAAGETVHKIFRSAGKMIADGEGAVRTPYIGERSDELAGLTAGAFLRVRRLCSDDDDFLVKSREMMTFFSQRGYPLTSLEHDLRKVRTIGRPDALSGSKRGDTPVDSVPLVMTYHPFNTYIKRYLLQHFRILSTDQQTRDIFPQPPIVAYKRDVNLRDILVHSTDSSSTEQPGSHACHRPRCQTCQFITPLTDIRGPKGTFTIRDHFTCTSENLVYCLSCRRCSHLYIGETGRSLRSRIGEHLRSIRNNTTQLRRSQYYRCPGARYAFVSSFQHPPQTTGNEANISAWDRPAGWP